MKLSQRPGYDDMLDFENGLTLHCCPETENSPPMGPFGVNVCVGFTIPGGSGSTFVIPLSTKKEVRMFTRFISRSFEQFNAEPDALKKKTERTERTKRKETV
jgi:hypothetical protein